MRNIEFVRFVLVIERVLVCTCACCCGETKTKKRRKCSSRREGVQNGNWVGAWPMVLHFQAICSPYFALSLACCPSPVTKTTWLSSIPLPSTFSYSSSCYLSSSYSSSFHILLLAQASALTHSHHDTTWGCFIPTCLRETFILYVITKS